MENFLLVRFELHRDDANIFYFNIDDFNHLGFEEDDPIEKRDILNKLPEWEISEIDIKDDDFINFGVYFEDSNEGKLEKDKFIEFMKFKISTFKFSEELIDNSNWEEEWKKSYKSFEIGENIIVKPSWEKIHQSCKIIIEIDPKMAFGTGTHETTSMCMEYAEKLDLNEKDILDIGCGSGILSILSKKLGAKKVDACDIDDIAINSTIENAKINQVEVNAFESDLFSNVNDKYDIIFANILAEILVKMIPQSSNFLKFNGKMVLSGIIQEKENMVVEALLNNNFQIKNKVHKGEWLLISAEKVC